MAIALLIILILLQAVPGGGPTASRRGGDGPDPPWSCGARSSHGADECRHRHERVQRPVIPKQDFTLTASPGIDLWLRAGRGLLTAEARLDIVYFAKYSTETSASRSLSAGTSSRSTDCARW